MKKRWIFSLLLAAGSAYAQETRPASQDQTPQVLAPPKVKFFDKLKYPTGN